MMARIFYCLLVVVFCTDWNSNSCKDLFANPGSGAAPRSIHQVWLGDFSRRPEFAMNSCKSTHGNWTYRVWTDADVANMCLSNEIKLAMSMGEPHRASDIMRLEVLYRHGGVYLDADSVCLRSFEPLMVDLAESSSDCFAGYEFRFHNKSLDDGRGVGKPSLENLVANGVIGCKLHSSSAALLVRLVSTAAHDKRSPWISTGPMFVTQNLAKLNFTVYGAEFFYPRHFGTRGTLRSLPKESFTDQHWGTSRGGYMKKPVRVSSGALLAKRHSCAVNLGGITCELVCTGLGSELTSAGESIKFKPRFFEALNNHVGVDTRCMVSYGEWFGLVGVYWLNANKNSTVHAFEPDPLAFGRLVNNFAMYGLRARAYHMCVNHDGSDAFVHMRGMRGSKLANHGIYKVPCTSFTDLRTLFPNCWHNIDIEGFELNLIEDILSNPPPAISLSVHTSLIADIITFEQKLRFLQSRYSKCTRTDDDGPDVYEMICSHPHITQAR